jgi:hypothetical protein
MLCVPCEAGKEVDAICEPLVNLFDFELFIGIILVSVTRSAARSDLVASFIFSLLHCAQSIYEAAFSENKENSGHCPDEQQPSKHQQCWKSSSRRDIVSSVRLDSFQRDRGRRPALKQRPRRIWPVWISVQSLPLKGSIVRQGRMVSDNSCNGDLWRLHRRFRTVGIKLRASIQNLAAHLFGFDIVTLRRKQGDGWGRTAPAFRLCCS